MLSRWLHIYLSMASFAIIFFFAVTGLTLNHAEKFGGEVHTKEGKGKMNVSWVKVADTTKIDKLAIVEYLRNTHSIHAALADFRIDDEQCTASFKGPGYAADVFINRDDGTYDIQETSAGFVGIINDLHKGRDAGPVWSVFIDIAASLMTLVSLTGMILIFYMKRKRAAGLMVALFGLLLAYIVYVLGVK
ncbi:MAG TPA: PepSY-associated TM helix domain-containing protein [Chitinophagaceae bacterium]|nr:PepSY-associated TM helix domain-containing protein [Chitinophagaceae bacterium]